MKIVVLDGFAANPGDLSWEGMKALGECTIYDRTAPEEVVERAAGAEVLLTNKVIISAKRLALTISFVSGVSGQCRLMMSHSLNSSSSSIFLISGGSWKCDLEV